MWTAPHWKPSELGNDVDGAELEARKISGGHLVRLGRSLEIILATAAIPPAPWTAVRKGESAA